MSLTSFSTPSDQDILNNAVEKSKVIGFVDKGKIYQNAEETTYVRLIKVLENKVEVIKKVTYSKRGISWLLKAIENSTFKNKSA